MSNPQKTELKIDKTAKVSVLKNEENPNDQLLIVLHGYGQLSQFFIQKFSSLTHQCDIIAPEGMHRFYLNGSSGRVGASWMTKEERETDIEDNQKYLEEVLSNFTQGYKKVFLLGFSQGGATAARFYENNSEKISSLILWASVIPQDCKLALESLNGANNYFVLGKNDEYFNPKIQKEVIDLHQNRGFRTIEFEGQHDIDSKTLDRLFDELK